MNKIVFPQTLVRVQVRKLCRPVLLTHHGCLNTPLIFIPDPFFLAQVKKLLMKNIIPVIYKHTVDMFHGTISWKIKSPFSEIKKK